MTGEGVSTDTLTLIENYGNRLYLCAESIKEMASVFRKMPFLRKKWDSAEKMVASFCEKYEADVLYPQREHYARFFRLQWNGAELHHDLSDLIIIAHAVTEDLTLVSSDRRFHFYRAQGLDFIYSKR